MQYSHFIEMRVFSKEGEDENLIMDKIKELFPFDFEKEKLNINTQVTYGFEDKKIKILSVSIKKERQIATFTENLFSKLTKEQNTLLYEQMDSRFDDKLHFYLRLDKEKLLNGVYEITESGNCFHFTISVATYPHSREAAVKIIEKLLHQD